MSHQLESALLHALTNVDPHSPKAREHYQELMEAAVQSCGKGKQISSKYGTQVHECEQPSKMAIKVESLRSASAPQQLPFVKYGAYYEFSSVCTVDTERKVVTLSRHCTQGDAFHLLSQIFVCNPQDTNKTMPKDQGLVLQHIRQQLVLFHMQSTYDGVTTVSNRTIHDVLWYLAAQISLLGQQDIVHCDIKLENIWFHEEVPYLGDHGLAKVITDELSTIRCGSEWYAPMEAHFPECLNPPRKHDSYSFGVVVYAFCIGEMLANQGDFLDWQEANPTDLASTKNDRGARALRTGYLRHRIAALDESIQMANSKRHPTEQLEGYTVNFMKRVLDLDPKSRPDSRHLFRLLLLYIWRDNARTYAY